MDGVRAFWNGERLLSKRGKEISCPDWFYRGLPNGTRLDGELWMGRGQLEATMAAINSKDEELWKKVKFMVFDVILSGETYEKRLSKLKNMNLMTSYASIVELKICEGNDKLTQQLNHIVSEGAEGLVVTEPNSMYTAGRTRTRLKVKVL